MKNWIHHVLLAGSSEGAYIVCSLISVLLLLHFMKCHRWVQRCNWNHGFFPMNQSAGTKILVTSCYSRDHVLKLYRGQRTFYQDVFVSPANLVVGIFTKTPRNFVPPSLLLQFSSAPLTPSSFFSSLLLLSSLLGSMTSTAYCNTASINLMCYFREEAFGSRDTRLPMS